MLLSDRLTLYDYTLASDEADDGACNLCSVRKTQCVCLHTVCVYAHYCRLCRSYFIVMLHHDADVSVSYACLFVWTTRVEVVVWAVAYQTHQGPNSLKPVVGFDNTLDTNL